MMTSKEALQQIMKIYGETGSLEGTYDLFLIIKQDLDRLEVLETTLLEYRDQEHLYWETAQNNASLRKENEKLKKVLEILKKYYKIIVKDCDFPIYEKPQYTLGIRFHSWNEKPEGLIAYITKEDFKLLKEVMNNEV